MIRKPACAAALFAIVTLIQTTSAQVCEPQWLSGAIPNPNGTVYSSILWDRDGGGPLQPALVVGGSFTLVGSVPVSNLALWDGIAWQDIGGGVSGTTFGATSVFALAVMPDGDLVVAGQFDHAGAIAANNIARYDGAAWSTFAHGAPMFGSNVLSLTVRPNGDLVAVGLMLNDDNTLIGAPARWNDNAPLNRWRPLDATNTPSLSVRVVRALSNGDVVVAGSSVGGASAIYRWNEGEAMYHGFGNGIVGAVLSLLELPGGDLVVGGGPFTMADDTAANNIARWDGMHFHAYGTGITSPGDPIGPRVHAIARMPNGDIIAAGNFNTAGGNPGGRIARWNGLGWTRLPQGAGDFVYTLTMLPSDELIIGGQFTFAGGSFSNKRVARYTDSPVPWTARQPQSQSVQSGDDVSFTASPAVGIAGVSYRWQRDGADIADGPGGASVGGGVVSGASGVMPSPTSGTSVTLSLAGAQPGDAGLYAVVFSNTCGGRASLPAELEVAGPACAADWNGADGLDSQDFFDFLDDFFNGDADFNGFDGTDSQDYFDFLEAFFVGCA